MERRDAEPFYDFTPIIERVVDEPERVPNALSNLSVRQREALELHFGLPDGVQRSYRQVAEAMNISRRLARRHVKKALANLRHPVRVDRRPSLEEILR